MTLEYENYRFYKKERLKGRRNIERLFKEGTWIEGESIKVVFIKNNSSISRFLLGVSKAQGKSYERNYLRRVLREIVRTSKADIPKGMDFCLIPVGKGFKDKPFLRKKEDVILCLKRCADFFRKVN